MEKRIVRRTQNDCWLNFARETTAREGEKEKRTKKGNYRASHERTKHMGRGWVEVTQ